MYLWSKQRYKNEIMKKLILGGSFALVAFLICSFIPATNHTSGEEIKWYTFEEAVKASKDHPKKMFIDLYTDWCGWCKKMDKSTFKDPQVIQYLNANFYPVKFNAEQKESIQFKGHELKYLSDVSRRGVHELAYALLDGRLGYPAFVYLDENQDRITISPGYKTADVIMRELKYVGGNHYKDTRFEDFKASDGE